MHRSEGFVEQRDARRHHEAAAELEQLLLAAGELAGVEIAHALEREFIEQLPRARGRLRDA